MGRWIAAAALLLIPFFAGASLASDWTYQGQLWSEDEGPASGVVDVELRLLHPDGSTRYVEYHERVPVSAGLFALRLGDGEPLESPLGDVGGEGSEGLVEILVDGEALGPPEQVRPPVGERNLAVDPLSPELRVFDGDGRELGIYAGERVQGGDQYFVHHPGVGLTLALRGSTGELGLRDVEVFYEGAGCQGQGFVGRRLSGVVFGQGEAGYLVGTATQALRPLTVQAVRESDGSCRDEVRELAEVVPVTSLETIPIELPVTAPLHVGVVGD
ncbi:MAG: hypothetical protein JRH10_18800 [Deltaproteobacteria bacterium]|nr:hypothetical protein [Deltaproteobacteria bacterium]